MTFVSAVEVNLKVAHSDAREMSCLEPSFVLDQIEENVRAPEIVA